jgi:hypothetical protein
VDKSPLRNGWWPIDEKVWQRLQGTALARVLIPKLKSPLKTLSNLQRCPSPAKLTVRKEYWEAVMRTKQRRCPILIEFKGQVVKSDLFATGVEQPADISMKIRDEGLGKPFRVRFDDSKSAWVVSTLEYS